MQVFTTPLHLLHAPQWYVADGTARPCPDDPARVPGVVAALAGAGHAIVEVAEGNPAELMALLARVHVPDYLEYLRTIHGLWTAEFGTDVDVLPDTFPRFRPAHRVHPRRPGKPSAQAGYYCFDMAAPITAGTYAAVVGGAECARAAADVVLHGQRAAYALCRPPGHHAGSDYCGGFCYLNNAAVAAEYLAAATGRRVAVLDIDYHHGNGTQDIFYERRDVLFVSIHADPNTQYPYFWGHAEETGAGEGEGFTHNFPLPRGTPQRTWLDTLARTLEIVGRFDPAALVLSLGVDTYEEDTVGDFGVTLDGFARAAGMINELHRPTAIIQEGGYNLEAVGDCVAAFLEGFEIESGKPEQK